MTWAGDIVLTAIYSEARQLPTMIVPADSMFVGNPKILYRCAKSDRQRLIAG
ncbi:hypothetical protein BACSTE_00015 [Bacteroides stercoris ATCC 43183]|uniref:Uncharacterized protein n=1 Tax=Bacteroides stercoris ATCC 43183 TaxID=449673 RepID=B0NKQ0_BACSE|nr:hypothetical protein BACSTE_00015 [Bacteroides stercoris ATCC 43183]